MSLITYSTDPEMGYRAQMLAFGLLHGPATSILPWPRRPFAAQYRIWGVGLSCAEMGQSIILNIDSTILTEGERVPALEITTAREAISAVFGEHFASWKDVIAVGAPTPQVQLSVGDAVQQASKIGTCGTGANWGNNRTGFLTAGHVATRSGNVLDSSGNIVGNTVLSLIPGRSHTGADVSVVESSVGSSTPSPFSNMVTLNSGQTSIDLRLVKGVISTHVIAKYAWFHFPSTGGTYVEIYSTSSGVTVPGDSGSAATVYGTPDLIGHVVGGNAGFSSYIQDVTYQLQTIATIPGFSNISI